jgi:hypothetical protein
VSGTCPVNPAACAQTIPFTASSPIRAVAALSIAVSTMPGGRRVYRNAAGSEFRLPNASQRACHKVPIQSLSLFASITTTSRSLVPSATAAIP